jgi:D-tagatose-1,6-bisphosphate aldolase subunit GatZ/KbaZ
LPLLSQYLPRQHDRVRAGALPNEPKALLRDKVREVAARYARACGVDQGEKSLM